MIGPGYVPTFGMAQIGGQPMQVLTFVADHAADMIRPDLTQAQQVRLIARGAGFLGSSKEYLQNIVSQFEQLGIVDPDCSALLQQVDDFLARDEGPIGKSLVGPVTRLSEHIERFKSG